MLLTKFGQKSDHVCGRSSKLTERRKKELNVYNFENPNLKPALKCLELYLYGRNVISNWTEIKVCIFSGAFIYNVTFLQYKLQFKLLVESNFNLLTRCQVYLNSTTRSMGANRCYACCQPGWNLIYKLPWCGNWIQLTFVTLATGLKKGMLIFIVMWTL